VLFFGVIFSFHFAPVSLISATRDSRFLARPIFAVLADAVFLISAGLAAHSDQILWKSSSVAFLPHQIVGWDEHDRGVRGQAQLEKAVEDVILMPREVGCL
jgi:hypothetical protein